MSRPFEIGVLLHTRHLIREDGKPPSFDELWEGTELAEEMGFHHVWLGDSVTVLDKARGDCLAVMAAIASKSMRIKVGTVPLLPALRNPVLLAHALATIDVISQGRLIIGVSVAPMAPYIRQQFEACGIPYHEKAGRLSESLEIMRRLWTEKTVTYHGRYFRLEDVGILPQPVQKPSVPMWIAADRSDNAFRRVARLGDGWFTTARTLEKFVADRQRIIAFGKEYSRSLETMPAGLYVTMNIHRDGERAREEGWAWMEEFFHQPRAQLIHHTAIFGSPEECSRFLNGYVDAGLNSIVVRIASSDVKQQMRLLLEEVNPRLNKE
jgi:alkanesulfonate monooxygenase SsuD/methylene tetrahydromethanopterin reductase-like flavin-dependent oxidoreductase (luciferase family)